MLLTNTIQKNTFTKMMILLGTGIFFFGCDDNGKLLYQAGKYSIRKKNIVSYYQASPDLFVNTGNGEVKINLNPFGKRLIPQEKITGVKITQVTKDSVQIHFTASDAHLNVKDEFIGVNIKHAVDSVAAKKQ